MKLYYARLVYIRIYGVRIHLVQEIKEYNRFEDFLNQNKRRPVKVQLGCDIIIDQVSFLLFFLLSLFFLF